MRWIKIADKQPKKDQRVLYFDGHEINLVCAKAYNRDSVNHWMPLPDPPLINNTYVLSSAGDIPLKLMALLEDKTVRFTDISEIREKLMLVFNELTDRDRLVLWQRFGLAQSEQRTLDQVGRVFSVTRERVRQIEKKAIRRLASGLLQDLGILAIPIEEIFEGDDE